MDKQCTKCKEHKPYSAFYKNTKAKDGYTCYCVACRKELNQSDAQKLCHKGSVLKRKYGIQLATYIELLQAQNGLCALCGEDPKSSLSVDADRATGQVTRLLCVNCKQSQPRISRKKATN